MHDALKKVLAIFLTATLLEVCGWGACARVKALVILENPYSDEGFLRDDAKSFRITSLNGLRYFICEVGLQNHDFKDCTVTLTGDLTYPDEDPDWNCRAMWFNNAESPFRGVFDGGGHSLINFRFSCHYDRSGLFAFLDGAVVRDLNFVNPSVGGKGQKGIDVAALAGYVSGVCSFENIRITNGALRCEGSDLGGIIGKIGSGASVSIEKCSADGSFAVQDRTGIGSNAGGMIGYIETNASVTVTDCSVSGFVTAGNGNAGGLVSECCGTLTVNSFTNNSEVRTLESSKAAGGVVGYLEGVCTMRSCFNNSPITSENGPAGGFIGSNLHKTCDIEYCANAGEIRAAEHGGGIIGYAGNDSKNPEYNVSFCSNAANVISENDAGGIIGGLYSAGSHRIDGNMNSGSVWSTGTGNYAGGIVGFLSGSGFYSANENSGAIVSNGKDAGGIVGAVEDESCIFSGCRNLANVYSAGGHAGGIVGYLGDNTENPQHFVTNCVNSGSIESGKTHAGGIVGGIHSANAEHWLLWNTNEGAVKAKGCAGGILGWTNGGGSFYMSKNLGNVTGSDSAGGIVGTVEELEFLYDGCTNEGLIKGGQQEGSIFGTDGFRGSLLSNDVFSEEGTWMILAVVEFSIILLLVVIMIVERKKEHPDPMP